jgi:uncharacterized membrane protein
MKKVLAAALAIIVFTFLVSAVFYAQLPEKVAIHWNYKGDADGYASKNMAVFLMPIVSVLLAALFFALPKIDPLRKNFKSFRGYYDGFVIVFLMFMAIVHFQIILWGVGIEISPNYLFPILFGALFFYLGILVENAKRNWFVGIRTPWTLSSDFVWDKTHKLGGKMFKACGVIALFGVLFGNWAMFFMIGPVLFCAIYLVVYSYVIFRKTKGKRKK